MQVVSLMASKIIYTPWLYSRFYNIAYLHKYHLNITAFYKSQYIYLHSNKKVKLDSILNICLGIKEIQGYQIGKNNTGSNKGSTVAKQLEQQKVYEPIKGDRDQYIYISFLSFSEWQEIN